MWLKVLLMCKNKLKYNKNWFSTTFIVVLCTVGTSAIFQQQDNLWSCGGETQRNNLFIGKDMIVLRSYRKTNNALAHKTKNMLNYWCWSSHIGRGMFTSWRGHRSHLTGEDGRKDWWSPSFCHVSCALLRNRKCMLSTHDPVFKDQHMTINILIITYTNFTSSRRHKLADQKTRKTLERGDFRLLHYAGEVTYCVVGKRWNTSVCWIMSFSIPLNKLM